MVVDDVYSLEGAVFTIFDRAGAVLYQDSSFVPPAVEEEVRRAKRSNNKNIIGRFYYAEKQLHGPSTTYFDDGSRSSLTLFKHGNREGHARAWSRSGSLLASEFYKEGCLDGIQIYFDADGKKRCELPYVHGRLHGTVSVYSGQEQLIREIHFQQGKRHGLDTMWDTMGITLYSFDYEEGMCVKRLVEDPIAQRHQI